MAETPIRSQMYEGRGINGETGAVFGTAINFDKPQPLDPNIGQSVNFRLESISSSRELSDKLRIAASASFSVGAGGVSAEFGLSNSKEVNSYYTYALMRCHVVNAPRTIRNVTLKLEAEELLRQHGWDAFSRSYGWEYVEGFVQGGAYYGLIEIQTTSRAEQQNVKAKLGGYWGPFKASAEFEKDLKDIQKHTTVNVSVTRTGGSGAVVPSDLDGMLSEARSFAQTVLSNPVPILALTADYARTVRLPNVPPPNSLPRQHQRDTLNDLGLTYLRLRDYKTNLEYVLSRPLTDFDEYRTLDNAEIISKRLALIQTLHVVGQEIDKVIRLGTTCADDYTQCSSYVSTISVLESPTIQGEMLNLKQMEEKIRGIEKFLHEHGMLGGGLATFDGSSAIRGDLTVGAGGNGRILARHVDGKADNSDGPGGLHLNHGNGQPVHIGGHHPANLGVHGDIHLDRDKTISSPGTLHVHADDHILLTSAAGLTVEGRIGTAGRHPVQGMPPGIHGGVHTFDLVAEGVIGVGPPGEFKASMWSDGAIRGKTKQFVIDHPNDPSLSLVHGAIEGPEIGVYYRGEGSTNSDGAASVELPKYFESLARVAGRTALVTPLSVDGESAVPLAVSNVSAGHFTVRTADGSQRIQRFFWEVKAVRADVDILKTEVRRA